MKRVLFVIYIFLFFIACSESVSDKELPDGVQAKSDSEDLVDSDISGSAENDEVSVDFDDIPEGDGEPVMQDDSENEAGDSDEELLDGWLYTSGNKIYNSDGSIFRGRGANIHDTRSCNACTWWDPDVDEVKRRIDELSGVWGANLMRLTLESYAAPEGRVHWKNILEDEEYLMDIVEIVEYIGTKPGVYVLLSVWIDPSLNDMGWPTEGTISIWKKLAEQFKDDSHVLFGLVNEPQMNYDNSRSPEVWEAMNSTVKAIREVEESFNGGKHLIAVQGTGGWARFLQYYIDHPIEAGGGENIIYETHVYDAETEFQSRFIEPSKHFPVIIGEYGPAEGYMTLSECEKLMEEAEKRDIPYLAWTFHMRCGPNLLIENSGGGCGVDMDLQPTEWGTLLKNQLSKPWQN